MLRGICFQGGVMIRIFSLVAVMLLGGCTVIPDNIQVPEGTDLVSYNRAVTGGDGVKGKTARWGGVIAGVENKPDKTYVEVVHFPLNHYGRPNTNSETIGRFKVVLDGFVEPIIFEEGRSITFTGQIATPVAGMVDEQPYMYPALDGNDYHMWRNRVEYTVQPMFIDPWIGWYSPFFYSHHINHPFYFNRPIWGPYWNFPRRVRYTETRTPGRSQPIYINTPTSSTRSTTSNTRSPSTNRTYNREVNTTRRSFERSDRQN